MTHKQWLDNEYAQWIKALQESTVHNFKKNLMIRRMLSLDSEHISFEYYFRQYWPKDILYKIGGIGYPDGTACHFGSLGRMIYYAQQILKRNPSSICEIGGGVGEFYAILRALGYKGCYTIYDLREVRDFQDKYLSEVEKQTGLKLPISYWNADTADMVISFYALGEFDEDTKEVYSGLIDKNPHGYIAWNPHSGASDDLSLFKHDIKITPGIEPGIKIIQW